MLLRCAILCSCMSASLISAEPVSSYIFINSSYVSSRNLDSFKLLSHVKYGIRLHAETSKLDNFCNTKQCISFRSKLNLIVLSSTLHFLTSAFSTSSHTHLSSPVLILSTFIENSSAWDKLFNFLLSAFVFSSTEHCLLLLQFTTLILATLSLPFRNCYFL
jgi:hypothetical protein